MQRSISEQTPDDEIWKRVSDLDIINANTVAVSLSLSFQVSLFSFPSFAFRTSLPSSTTSSLLPIMLAVLTAVFSLFGALTVGASPLQERAGPCESLFSFSSSKVAARTDQKSLRYSAFKAGSVIIPVEGTIIQSYGAYPTGKFQVRPYSRSALTGHGRLTSVYCYAVPVPNCPRDQGKRLRWLWVSSSQTLHLRRHC